VDLSAEVELVSWVRKDTNGVPIEKRRVYTLQCVVGTNEWRIDSDFVSNANVADHFDGTNTYQRIQITRAPTGKLKDRLMSSAEVPFEIAKSNVTINIFASLGGVPHGDLGVNIPWLAFCSGSYLKLPGRAVPLPTISPGAPDTFAYADKTEVFDDELGLPKRLDLFTSKAQYDRSVWDERLMRLSRVERSRLNPRHSFEDGILKFSYVVEESTNVLGWTFPMKFSFVTYQPRKDKWEKSVAGTGRMTSIRESEQPRDLFEPGMATTIKDHRFRHETRMVESIVYSTTNAALLPIDDPVLQSKFQAKVARAPLDLVHRVKLTRLVLWVFLSVTAIVLVGYFVYRRMRENPHNNKTHKNGVMK
jgi:hypothetical protein